MGRATQIVYMHTAQHNNTQTCLNKRSSTMQKKRRRKILQMDQNETRNQMRMTSLPKRVQTDKKEIVKPIAILYYAHTHTHTY